MKVSPPVYSQKRTIYLHIGSDKAGSTALQLHLVANLEQLEANDIYMVEHGNARILGHHGAFFSSLSEESFADLIDELDGVPFDKAILMSWEGIHFIGENALKQFGKRFPNCEFKVIFYVREQADVIQSGLLQRIKGCELPASVLYDPPDYKLVERDYYKTVKKFERALPNSDVDVQLYDRAAFPEGNIFYDFFNRLVPGIEFENLTVFDRLINSSLTVEQVQLLALLEKYGDLELLEQRRAKAIDLLLAGFASDLGVNSSYFYTEDAVNACRQYFRHANQKLISEYGVSDRLVTKEKAVWAETAVVEPIDQEKEMMLENGQQLLFDSALPFLDNGARKRDGASLFDLLSSEGWLLYDEKEVWTSAQRSVIRGRLRFQSVTPLVTGIRLSLVGAYAPGVEESTNIRINGKDFGCRNLSLETLEIPVDEFQSPYELEIELCHDEDAGIAPADFDDILRTKTRVNYRLRVFSCGLIIGKPVALVAT